MASRYRRLGGRGDVRIENASLDTVGSAVFTRLLYGHMIAGKAVTVVTSDFHRDRSEHIYDHVFCVTHPAVPVKCLEIVGLPTNEAFPKRQEKEKQSLASSRIILAPLTEYAALLDWFTKSHTNYNPDFTSRDRNFAHVEAY